MVPLTASRRSLGGCAAAAPRLLAGALPLAEFSHAHSTTAYASIGGAIRMAARSVEARLERHWLGH